MVVGNVKGVEVKKPVRATCLGCGSRLVLAVKSERPVGKDIHIPDCPVCGEIVPLPREYRDGRIGGAR